MKVFIWFSVFFCFELSCFVSGFVKCLCIVYNFVEYKFEFLSLLKLKDEMFKFSECDLGDLLIFFVEKFVFFFIIIILLFKFFLVREMCEFWSGVWVFFLCVWGREFFLIKFWLFGFFWEDFFLFLVLKFVFFMMLYFLNFL